jgi:hypothetical protein
VSRCDTAVRAPARNAARTEPPVHKTLKQEKKRSEMVWIVCGCGGVMAVWSGGYVVEYIIYMDRNEDSVERMRVLAIRCDDGWSGERYLWRVNCKHVKA